MAKNLGYRKVSAKTMRAPATSSPRPRWLQLSALNLVSKAQALGDVPYVGPFLGVSKTIISGFVIEYNIYMVLAKGFKFDELACAARISKISIAFFLTACPSMARQVAFVTGWIAAILASHPRTFAERNISSLRDEVHQARLVIGDLGQPIRKLGVGTANLQRVLRALILLQFVKGVYLTLPEVNVAVYLLPVSSLFVLFAGGSLAGNIHDPISFLHMDSPRGRRMLHRWFLESWLADANCIEYGAGGRGNWLEMSWCQTWCSGNGAVRGEVWACSCCSRPGYENSGAASALQCCVQSSFQPVS